MELNTHQILVAFRRGLEYFLIPFLEKTEDLDANKSVTISSGAQLVSGSLSRSSAL